MGILSEHERTIIRHTFIGAMYHKIQKSQETEVRSERIFMAAPFQHCGLLGLVLR